MYEPASAPVDPYSEEYSTVTPAPPPPEGAPATAADPPPPSRDRERERDRNRSRSRSPPRYSSSRGHRSPEYRRNRSPPPRRSAPVKAPTPSNVLGVFGLSIRTQERDLEDEFGRFGRVDKVTIVYDQRSDRSRGFGFIKMNTVEDATKCIQELNGIDLNGRRIRVDYSVTERPHNPTPGEYMGHRRSGGRERDTYRDRDSHRGDYRDRDRDSRDHRRGGGGDRDKDRDRDPYGRDNRDSRDWRERRSPPPSRGGRYSPEYRRRRSYSRSPPRGSSPSRAPRDYDAPGSNAPPAVGTTPIAPAVAPAADGY